MKWRGIEFKERDNTWQTSISKALLEKIRRLSKENEELKKHVEKLQQYEIDREDAINQKIVKIMEDDSYNEELYNLDITIAKFVLPRLQEFKNNLFGTPYPLTKEEYNDILDKMIWSFDIISRGDHIIMDDDENDKRVQEGLDLFAKYFRNLWM